MKLGVKNSYHVRWLIIISSSRHAFDGWKFVGGVFSDKWNAIHFLFCFFWLGIFFQKYRCFGLHYPSYQLLCVFFWVGCFLCPSLPCFISNTPCLSSFFAAPSAQMKKYRKTQRFEESPQNKAVVDAKHRWVSTFQRSNNKKLAWYLTFICLCTERQTL